MTASNENKKEEEPNESSRITKLNIVHVNAIIRDMNDSIDSPMGNLSSVVVVIAIVIDKIES